MERRELYDLPIFADTTDDELDWLLANSRPVMLQPGEYIFREGDPPQLFYVVLEGEMQITRTINGELMVLGTTPRGIIGGEAALLSGTDVPAAAQAIAPTRLMTFDLAGFRGIFANCPTVAAHIMRVAYQRSEGLATVVKQQEKMAALGKLSAGLAHELNNPASAARRTAHTLRELLPDVQRRALDLSRLNLSSDQLAALAGFQRQAVERAVSAPVLSTIERADREDELGTWLEEQEVGAAWELAANFVGAGLTLADLHRLADAIGPACLGAVCGWLNATLSADGLLAELELSTRRISDLVGAVKSYTFMDQATVQEVDINRGLDDTLTVMSHKLRSITVMREYDPDLPRIQARGGELNQVWTNFVDNAAHAMDGKGTLRVVTRCENDFVMVEVTDDGPGIPSDTLPHIFEPFFTTKGVGVGTGLGLDICYRIVQQHNGTIEVQSKPGETRFIVRLPVVSEQ